MTSFSIVAANVPLALAFDPGSESRSSLGIVIIGGVLSSLVLTLALIPNMYMWFAPSDERFKGDGHRKTAAEPGPLSVSTSRPVGTRTHD
jgi:multidrug efflux pump